MNIDWMDHTCDVCLLLNDDESMKSCYYNVGRRFWVCGRCDRPQRLIPAMLKRDAERDNEIRIQNGWAPAKETSIDIISQVMGRSIVPKENPQLSREQRVKRGGCRSCPGNQ